MRDFPSEPLGFRLPRVAPLRRLRVRELRLASGLVIGLFVLCHFANHALGLVSLDAMEAGRPVLSGPWRTKPGSVLLYGAVLVHFALALRVLFVRRTLRLSPKEAAQTAFGFLIPLLLIGHVLGTRIEFAYGGVEPTYPAVIRNLWNPVSGVRQAVALLVVWVHVALGVYFWLRPKPAFGRTRQGLFAFALLLPVLSLLGFVQAGKELAARPNPVPPLPPLRPTWAETVLALSLAVPVGAVLLARGFRAVRSRRSRIRITYPGGRTVDVPRGFSVLEASRAGRIPHRSVCGGKARCSTCRVAVLAGGADEPRPNPDEAATLRRIEAGPTIRLACQFRPLGDVEVVPLLSDPSGWSGRRDGTASFGRECTLAVLFCDLRGFTSFAERRLPFDVVFILNRYFETVGAAVAASGGVVDKFIGDGAMALFGLEGTPEEAARGALKAAERIRSGLDQLNRTYAGELREPLRVVIAIHGGPAIVGEIGQGAAQGLTALGDTVNVASRLEGLAKASDAELVLSDEVARQAGADLAGFHPEMLTIRGRSQPLKAWLRPADPSRRPASAAPDA